MEKTSAILFDCKSVVKHIYKLSFTQKITDIICLNKESIENPIILIHGSGDNQFAWTTFINGLTKTNPIYAFTLDLNFENGIQENGSNPLLQRFFAKNKNTKIEEYASKLEKYINFVYEKHNKPVILIGSSMGGLVARYCDCILNNPNIFHIITIGTPHKGAPLLQYKFVKMIFNTTRHSQMTPQSNFLNNESFTVINKEKYTTLGSVHDIHVPDEYSKIEGVEHVSISDCGHIGLLHSPIVINHINQILYNLTTRT